MLDRRRRPSATVRARAVVNAAGPWAEAFLRGVARRSERAATRRLRLVKGSHIVVPRLFDHDHAYIFQNPDKRIIFAIPYEDDFTLIGTTDVELQGDDPGAARIGARRDRLPVRAGQPLLRAARPAVRRGLDLLRRAPAARRRVGRPLRRHARLPARTRTPRAAPLLSVWGGKITTFRKLAEEAADQVGRMLGERRAALDRRRASCPAATSRTGSARAAAPRHRLRALRGGVHARHPWLRRVARAAAGARLRRRIVECSLASRPAWAPRSRRACTRRELDYLQRHEWALQRRRRAVAAQQAGPALHAAAARPRSRAWMRAPRQPRSEKGARMQLSSGRRQQEGRRRDLALSA